MTHRAKVEWAFAIVAAGTGVGFLTGLFGVGGGFVIVPALALLLGLSMPVAIGTSLLVITINSAVALASRIAIFTTIDWAVTIPFTISAVVGVLVGGRLAGRLDPQKSLRWFVLLLVGVAIYTAAKAVVGLVGDAVQAPPPLLGVPASPDARGYDRRLHRHLEWREHPDPVPGTGEVLVRVHAAKKRRRPPAGRR